MFTIHTDCYLNVRSVACDYRRLLKTDKGVEGHPADSYLEIQPNAIERHYAELYDRSIAKQLAFSELRHES